MSADSRIIQAGTHSMWPPRGGLQTSANLLYDADAKFRQVVLGPAPMAELFWRVKELTFSVDYDMSASAGDASVSETGTYSLTVGGLASDVWGGESSYSISNPSEIVAMERGSVSSFNSGGVRAFYAVGSFDSLTGDLDTSPGGYNEAGVSVLLELFVVLDRVSSGDEWALYVQPTITYGAFAVDDDGVDNNYANVGRSMTADVAGEVSCPLTLTGIEPTILMTDVETSSGSGGEGASVSVSVTNPRITIGEFWTYGGAISSSTGLPV